jgi:uncharacterized protein (TIGR03086 family)
MELPELYDIALERAGRIVGGVHDDQLRDPTPCTEWNVAVLTNHLIGGTYGFAAAAAGQDVDFEAEPPDFSSMDRKAAWEEGAKSVRAALHDAIAAGRSLTLPIGTLPAAQAMGVSYIDLVVHGWDLAKATAQDATIPDELAIAAYEMMKDAVAPEMRQPGPMAVFGKEIPVPESASPTDKLVAFLGRKP